jgi:hypothetical protein
MTEPRDTDISSLRGKDVMPSSRPPPRHTTISPEGMSDRDLLLKIVQSIEEDRVRHARDWTIAMRYMQSLNVAIGRQLEAEEISREIERSYPPNGAHHDEPTNPGAGE